VKHCCWSVSTPPSGRSLQALSKRKKNHSDGQVHPIASSGYSCHQMIKRFRFPPQSRSTALSLFWKEACLIGINRKKKLRRPGSPHSKQRILLPPDDQAISIPASVPKYRAFPFWNQPPHGLSQKAPTAMTLRNSNGSDPIPTIAIIDFGAPRRIAPKARIISTRTGKNKRPKLRISGSLHGG
jgi:hypothetical protein